MVWLETITGPRSKCHLHRLPFQQGELIVRCLPSRDHSLWGMWHWGGHQSGPVFGVSKWSILAGNHCVTRPFRMVQNHGSAGHLIQARDGPAISTDILCNSAGRDAGLNASQTSLPQSLKPLDTGLVASNNIINKQHPPNSSRNSENKANISSCLCQGNLRCYSMEKA